MSELTPGKIQEFFESATKANADAWSTQAKFHEQNLKRNIDCFTGLSNARMESFKEMSQATTLTQAFEANLAFEEQVREDLQELYEGSVKAWEDLMQDMQSIYALTPAEKKSAAAGKAKTTRQPA